MLLSTQLKRGYLALIGLLLLSLGLFATPETSAGPDEFVRKPLVLHICKANHQSRWKLASTPFDMPSLPGDKIRLCRA